MGVGLNGIGWVRVRWGGTERYWVGQSERGDVGGAELKLIPNSCVAQTCRCQVRSRYLSMR